MVAEFFFFFLTKVDIYESHIFELWKQSSQDEGHCSYKCYLSSKERKPEKVMFITVMVFIFNFIFLTII